MNTSDIITIVSSLGFPIVMCGILAWYVYQTSQNNREDIKAMTERYEQTYKEFSIALNNNTLALQKLTDRIQRKEDGE